MKTFIKLFAIIAACSILQGCPAPPLDAPQNRKHFVRVYFELSKTYFTQLPEDENLFQISYKLVEVYTISEISKEKEKKEKYNRLAAKHNDLNFPHKYRPGSSAEGMYVIGYDFTKVEIFCDADYDDEHPAGTDLGDIATFYSTSLYPFTKSGYKNIATAAEIKAKIEEPILSYLYPESYSHSTGNYYSLTTFFPNHPIVKKVSELTKEDLVMIGGMFPMALPNIAVIKLDKKPKTPGNYAIEVVFTKDYGDYKLKSKGTMIFN